MCRPAPLGMLSEAGSSGPVSFIRTDTGLSRWLEFLYGASFVRILPAPSLRLGVFGIFTDASDLSR